MTFVINIDFIGFMMPYSIGIPDIGQSFKFIFEHCEN